MKNEQLIFSYNSDYIHYKVYNIDDDKFFLNREYKLHFPYNYMGEYRVLKSETFELFDITCIEELKEIDLDSLQIFF